MAANSSNCEYGSVFITWNQSAYNKYAFILFPKDDFYGNESKKRIIIVEMNDSNIILKPI